MSRYVPPGAQYDYRPPSVFAQYKGLSVFFALLLLVMLLAWGLARHFHRQPAPAPLAAPVTASPPSTTPSAAPADPVYVSPIAPPAPR